MRRHLAPVLIVGGLLLGNSVAHAATPAGPRAQVFATPNTAVITDPGDPRLRTRLTGFERDVRGIIRANGATAGGSTLLDGVFWSAKLQMATYERSREFDVTKAGVDGLHRIADAIRRRYHQESVLTFEYLSRTSPRADAVEIEVQGVDVRHLHDALLADPAARDHLVGGSVTEAGRLVLVTTVRDLALARRFAAHLAHGRETERYGDEEFVARP
jgi:hypothetical protein